MLLRRIARPMLASMFITGGLATLRAPQAHMQAAKPVLNAAGPAIARAVEASPMNRQLSDEAVVRIDGGVNVLAGVLLATGRCPRLASTALAASLVPTTLSGHRFWNSAAGAERQTQQVQFFKNMSLLGGLLIAAADTGGKPSLGWRGRRAGRLAAGQAGMLAGVAANRRGRKSGRARKRSGTAAGLAAGLAGTGAAMSSRAGDLSKRASEARSKAEKRGAALQRDAAKRSAKAQKRAAKRGAAWQKAAAKKRAELERKAPGYDQIAAQAIKQAGGAAKDARKRMAPLSR